MCCFAENRLNVIFFRNHVQGFGIVIDYDNIIVTLGEIADNAPTDAPCPANDYLHSLFLTFFPAASVKIAVNFGNCFVKAVQTVISLTKAFGISQAAAVPAGIFP